MRDWKKAQIVYLCRIVSIRAIRKHAVRRVAENFGNFFWNPRHFLSQNNNNLEPFFRNVHTHSNTHWFKLVQRSLVATYIATVKMKEKYPINRHLIVWCQTIIWQQQHSGRSRVWCLETPLTLWMTNFPSIHLFEKPEQWDRIETKYPLVWNLGLLSNGLTLICSFFDIIQDLHR